MRFLYSLILLVIFNVAVGLAQPPKTLKMLSPNGGEKYRPGTSVDLRWETFAGTDSTTFRSRFNFQFATSPNGPWSNLSGATNRLDSATLGAFAGGFRIPATKTTTGYLRIVLLNTDGSENLNVVDVTDAPFEIEQPVPVKIDSVLSNAITGRVQLSNKKIYGLNGYVFVNDGGTLAIQPGTIIVGDTVGENSAICVNRGGKIFAKGTATHPIIMTSSAPVGQRRGGDWGGVLICGKASTNHPGGEAALEGGIADDATLKTRGWFGGKTTPDDNDSSGVLQYVRIEFAGIAAAPNQELNSLTMGGVGRGTVIDHIQVSYGNDDAYEWFGGTVNAKHLIAIGTLDDDFDGDNGWSGKVQFGLVQRFKERADASTSQAFEMDNDASGSYNGPLSSPVFSNITAIGPVADTSWTATSTGTGANVYHNRFGAGAQIRRNSRASILNTIFLGWPRGMEVLSSQAHRAANSDSLGVRNNNWFGIKGVNLVVGSGALIQDTWLETANFNNVIDKQSGNNARLTNPFATGVDINPVPTNAANYLTNANFTSFGTVPINDNFFTKVSYRGAFSSNPAERWDLPWAEYDPINKEYFPQVLRTVKLLYPAGGETFRPGTSVDIRYDTTLTFRERFTFQFATNVNGPWTNLPGASNRLDSATRGVFAGGFRVPALKTTSGFIRMVLVNADGSLNESISDINDVAFNIDQPAPSKVDSVLSNPITGRVQLSNKKIYGLNGYVFVNDGGTLAIDPGTIIVGDTVGENSAICINRGGKIYAKGTPTMPIVMTSSAVVGQRRGGDWGGLLICGKASTNHPGGEAALEGGIADDATLKTRGWFGGRTSPDDNDSSGVLQYVRIEFAGIAAAPNQELNSLTMGAVGRKTVIDHIQVSYGNDDAYEWFGGTVNAKHLIAIGTLDDDFDTDNGFSGKIQFGLVQRHKDRADASTSQAFEQDNDASGSFNSPLSSPIFSNITAIGPLADTSWTSTSTGTAARTYHNRFGAGAQIRRNSRASIVNTVFLGWPRGMELLSSQSQNAAKADSILIRNNQWYGVKGVNLVIGSGATITDTYLDNTIFNNTIDKSSAINSRILNPFEIGNGINPKPGTNATFLNSSNFTKVGSVDLSDSFFDKVPYIGAFNEVEGERWDLPWAEYDPNNKEYKAFVDPVLTKVTLKSPAGGEQFKPGMKVDLKWDTVLTLNKKFAFQFGTNPNGPWLNIPGVESVLDNGTNRGEFKEGFTVPNTLTTTGYVRMVLLNEDGSYNEQITDRNDAPFTIEDNKPVELTTVKLLYPTGGLILRPGTSVDLRWDTTLTFKRRFTFQFGTSKTGPWTNLQGATNRLDSATRGVFAGGFRVPAISTTSGFVRMVLLNADGTLNEEITDINDEAFYIEQPAPVMVDSVLSTPIIDRVQLSNTKIYGLNGYVFVNDGGTLAIQPGTIIVGDTVGENSAICINRGGKIYAKGTPQLPIIMTSSATIGQRRGGDWGGVLICGKASTNHPGGEAALEGGIADDATLKTRGWFGGKTSPDDTDSSGVMQYVRIEFAGIAAAPNQELNSLTMGAVGNKTVIDHIQVSYGNDDAYEWFGGTVNAKHLIAIGTLDDDFDTDNGFSGKVQFGLVQRFKDRADASTSQAFEMDNDASGSYNAPLSSSIFSNITAIGPLADTSWTSTSTGTGATNYHNRFGAGAQIRRNSRASIVNTIFLGWPRGIEVLSSQSQNAANNDSLIVRNNSWFGVKGANMVVGSNPVLADTWLETAGFNNVINKQTADNAKLTAPFTVGLGFNPVPKLDADYLNTASFANVGSVSLDNEILERVTYRGAFSELISLRWDLPWSEYDPINKEYKAQPVTSIEREDNITGELFEIGVKVSPNPTTELASIVYNLPTSSEVTVRLYNSVGNLVDTIAENLNQTEGFYSFDLDFSNVVSGVYYIQIYTPNGSVTKTINVIK